MFAQIVLVRNTKANLTIYIIQYYTVTHRL